MAKVFGVRIDDVSDYAFDRIVDECMQGGEVCTFFTPNAEMVLQAKNDLAFAETLNKSTISILDGAGLRFACAATGEPVVHRRRTGVDTLLDLAHECAETQSVLVLTGSTQSIAQRAAENLRSQFESLEVHAIAIGHVSSDGYADPTALDELRSVKPAVLAVALGHGKQERFIERYKDQIPTLRIAIGVGGALDMISGERIRAPRVMRTFGIESLWRLAIEPKRFLRIARAIFVFPAVVAYDRLKQRDFLASTWRVIKELVRFFFHQQL